MKAKLFGLFAGLGIYALTVQPAAAISFTASGSDSDGPVSAQADFTISNGQILVTIDPPPLKWSDLRYVSDIQEDYNGKEALQA